MSRYLQDPFEPITNYEIKQYSLLVGTYEYAFHGRLELLSSAICEIRPWGAVSYHRRLAAQNELRRQQHIKDVYARVETTDDDVIHQREYILSLGFFDLRGALQSGSLGAVDVLNAFVWKAALVQRDVNCIVDFLDEAFDQAKELDLEWKHTSTGKPPLFGIPFSVKGNFF
ncbi:unnamed protein product, partial [Gongylonema pulchrum]|uniref:Amidase domain-containing protein n=1 Tax=Gongylonema pulchrum TaxID=637853 RepID=A0A183EY61_9BILA